MKQEILLSVLLTLLNVISTLSYRWSPEFKGQVMSYPNVQRQKSSCLPELIPLPVVNYICDKNAILKEADVKDLIKFLDVVNSRSSTDNSCDLSNPKPTMYLALVDKILKPDSEGDADDALRHAAAFSYHLYQSWGIKQEKCPDTHLVVFYSSSDGVVYTYAGAGLKSMLTKTKIIQVSVEARQAFDTRKQGEATTTSTRAGLKYILQRYKDIFDKKDKGVLNAKSPAGLKLK